MILILPLACSCGCLGALVRRVVGVVCLAIGLADCDTAGGCSESGNLIGKLVFDSDELRVLFGQCLLSADNQSQIQHPLPASDLDETLLEGQS